MDVSERTILVTGGASGIGLATARVLAETGAGLVLADRDAAGVQAAAEGLRAEGAPAEARALDVTDSVAVRDLVEELDRRVRLKGVVNAAGILQMGTVADVADEDWERVLAVNLTGTFAVCKAAIPALARRGGGAIVNLASIGGRTRSHHSAPNYVASKAGVIGLTMSLAAQHAADGIRVNCVAPGVIDTPMTSVLSDEQRAASLAAIPAGRLGDAREVAHVIASLLSDGWSYVTGQTINVNGGLFMQ
jgi:NAD(P)-dependent dehydrogenase (short-subunit alcohol dehydrogenase family)